MEIRGLMQFTRASIEKLELTPAEEGLSASLVISANLTPELAAIMRCRDAIFTADGKPHPHITRMDLGDAKLRDVDLSLPSLTDEGGFDTYRPEIIHSFRVTVDGMLASLAFRARMKGKYEELVIFAAEQNKEDFECSIRALQQEFDWSGSGGTGTRVEMGGGKAGKVSGPLFTQAAYPCLHCDTEVPKNEDGMHMVNGELVACENGIEKPEATSEPALPAMHIVGSGRGPKQRNRRKPDDSPELRGDIAGEHHPVDNEPVFPVN